MLSASTLRLTLRTPRRWYSPKAWRRRARPSPRFRHGRRTPTPLTHSSPASVLHRVAPAISLLATARNQRAGSKLSIPVSLTNRSNVPRGRPHMSLNASSTASKTARSSSPSTKVRTEIPSGQGGCGGDSWSSVSITYTPHWGVAEIFQESLRPLVGPVDVVLDDDVCVLGGVGHTLARPDLAPGDQAGAYTQSSKVRVDVAVDRDGHEGAVDHICVTGDGAVGRDDDHGVLGEVQRMPLVEQLLQGHVRCAGVGQLAGVDQNRNRLGVLAPRRPRRVAPGNLVMATNLAQGKVPGEGKAPAERRQPRWFAISITLRTVRQFR